MKKALIAVFNISVFLAFFNIARISAEIESCGQIHSNDGTFPWNIGIYIHNDDSGLELICFGTLIKKNVAITAAHCLCDNLGGSVRNATFYLSKETIAANINLKDLNPSNFILKKNIMINPQFNGYLNSLSADLALIKLNTEVTTENNPVCIDWSNFNKQSEPVGKLPIWTGNQAKITTKEYLNDENCAIEAPQKFSLFLTSDKFCLKTNDRVKSSGKDGGSGVVYLNPEDNLWYLKGVVSNYDPTEGKLTTSTQISQYLNWISNIHASL